MDSAILNGLKIDLGIINSTVYDSRLDNLLEAAKKEIEREGAVLNLENVDDQNLIIDYARYMWLSRREPQDFPRSLRWRINNRVFDKKEVSDGE